MPLFVRQSTQQMMLIREEYFRKRIEDLRNQVVELKKRNEELCSEKETSIINEGRHQLELLPLLQLAVHGIASLKETIGEQEKQSVNLTEIAGSNIFQLQVRALSQACTMHAEMTEWVESLIPHLKKRAQVAARERAESFYRQMHTFLEEYSGLVGKEEEEQQQGRVLLPISKLQQVLDGIEEEEEQQQQERGRPLFSQSVPPLTEEELNERIQDYLASPHRNILHFATETGKSEEEEENKEDEPPILVGSVVWHAPDKEEKEEKRTHE